jgi:hypothetical protein
VFEQKYDEWMQAQLNQAESIRRREILQKGLGRGTIDFLKEVWFPAIGNFDHLYPEWEVKDFNNGYRYLDLAYMPGGAKGGIEIQGYRTHARDIDVTRFKDLCMRHCLLTLDGWSFLPIAYLSIKEEPKQCQQIVLAFVGRFISTAVPDDLNWVEAETLRYARRMLRPFNPSELAAHLRISERHARRVLHQLVEKNLLRIASGNQRYRTYQL